MSAKNKKDELNTLDQSAAEAEEKERAYLENDELIPEIADDYEESFSDILNTYDGYAHAANLEEDTIERDNAMLRKAFVFAFKAHRNQKRKNGSLYIIHPLAVAGILADLKVDANTLAAALLHDTIEDTAADFDMVSRKFGEAVANLVDGVTKLNLKLDNVIYNSKDDIQASNVRKMLVAMSDDIRVIFIKLADRLHNMRTLKFQTPDKQIEKAQETLDIYVPFAGRFGIYRVKWELEDLCLKYLHPEEFDKLVKLVRGNREQREDFMEQVISEIRAKLEENGITHYDIEGRPKHFYSIYKKMHDKGKTIDEIYDLFACRIIVDEVIECYQVLGIIHEMYQHVPGRFKDYIAMPKENKYQSIHTTVVSHNHTPFEVQIRTFAMHQIAEYGIAAHWHYKESGNSSEFKADKFDRKMDEMRQIIDSQSELADSGEFLESLKMSIAPDDEIFIYTPKHEVIKLPRGSCPIDFAYAIHSGIGNHMHGAKVNGRIVPLSYELQNGEIVEILSSPKLVKGPSRDWVKIVKTPNAKSKINNWFKKEARGENITTGKELLYSEIGRNGFTPDKLLMHKSIETILRRNNFSSLDDMYAAIGYGSISVTKVFSRLRDDYIRNCSEEERTALGYRITADGNIVYSPVNLPIEIGKIDVSRTGKSAKGKQATPETTKQVASYDVSKLGALNSDPNQPVTAAAIRSGVRPEELAEQAKGEKNSRASAAKRTHSNDEVIVDGIEAISTHISKCCHPVFGDDIIGFITREKGVGIHKTSCKNIQNIKNKKGESQKDDERYQRLVPVHWQSKAKFSSYDVLLIVCATDRNRLLLDVLDKINEEKINIVKLNTVVDGKDARIYVTVNISGKEQLDRTIARIQTVKDVTEIIRD
ncbi:MAG: bifunctional (p)ppGpp synthetase/guanosine-3',5'-bis(diphosphate) 3'-pyrophosphohydrolase [Ruminococcaceae bacterium]|nr:bifunctional (p)ppGpp synthetase/guanosine-3',5'-bis(diphosphate) 3'-pyrophosphohydrolase [Oscillospiraceae bacterium]